MSDEGSAADTARRGGFGSLGTAIGLLVMAWAAVIASFPLNDNSFLTHLATGRLILERGSVPSTDPYTFTAQGADWTVQSWLPSIIYAGAERAGGVFGLRLVVLAMLLGCAVLLWRLSRPATSVVVRLLLVATAMFVATGLWGERPYMVGVIGLAVVWLALEGTVRPWLLVPLLWLWANSHGSYVLSPVLIVLVIVGTAMDRIAAGDPPTRAALSAELAVLGATLVGIGSAVIGPLGFDVLTFPFKALTQSEVLAEIIEWQPPEFRTVSERVFLVLAVAATLAIVRLGRWRLALPTVVFAVAAFYAQRNLVMATVVLVPVIAAGAPRVGTLTGSSRPALGPVLSAVSASFLLLAVLVAVVSPTQSVDPYADAAVAWLGPVDGSRGLRVATDMKTGNLLEVLDGATGQVFIDDRADMFPQETFADFLVLSRGEARWSGVLDRYGIDVVVWDRSEPLAALLAADRDWQVVLSQLDAVVACRRSTGCERLSASLD